MSADEMAISPATAPMDQGPPPADDSAQTTTTQPASETTASATQQAQKKKRKRKKTPRKPTTITERSLRHPTWAYIRLQYLSGPRHGGGGGPGPDGDDLDAVTAHLHLQAALSAFLGLHGAAIPLDILKLERRDVWIRVPAEDRAAVLGAVGGWVGGGGAGWRARGWSSWNANADGGREAGQDLFQ